jgi:hypothetical protein
MTIVLVSDVDGTRDESIYDPVHVDSMNNFNVTFRIERNHKNGGNLFKKHTRRGGGMDFTIRIFKRVDGIPIHTFHEHVTHTRTLGSY